MRSMLIYYVLSFIFLGVHASANSACPALHIATTPASRVATDKIKGYFDLDNLEDYIEIIRDKEHPDKVTLSVFTSTGVNFLKKVSFEIKVDDFSIESPLQNLFISNPKKGEIIVGVSCCASFKTTESSHYKYFKEIDSWIYYKFVSATINSDFIPDIEIEYQDFSFSVDGKTRNNKILRTTELKRLAEENASFLDDLYNRYKRAFDSKKIDGAKGNLNFDELAILLFHVPINKVTISKYNDLAYYLSLSKSDKMAAIFLLRKIIETEPARIVAYLNLADAQWGIEQYENASKNYKKYDLLMKANHKDISRIPPRVKERMKAN